MWTHVLASSVQGASLLSNGALALRHSSRTFEEAEPPSLCRTPSSEEHAALYILYFKYLSDSWRADKRRQLVLWLREWRHRCVW